MLQEAAAVPLGRVARADDIARMAVFLASSEAEYLTGYRSPWPAARSWNRMRRTSSVPSIRYRIPEHSLFVHLDPQSGAGWQRERALCESDLILHQLPPRWRVAQLGRQDLDERAVAGGVMADRRQQSVRIGPSADGSSLPG